MMENKIDTSTIASWNIATKTKGLKAKPMSSLVVDDSVLTKFLLATLEGNEMVSNTGVVCIGESDDVWQQSPTALFKKYDVVGLDDAGWMICKPKPDNEVECFEVQQTGDFYIIGLWGEETPEGDLVQHGKSGDVICRQLHDHSDVWIVAGRLFRSTYNIQIDETLIKESQKIITTIKEKVK